MSIDQTISQIINEFGTQIWLGFVTFVITGFVLTILKEFVADIVYYFRARMSDIGYGQRIYWKNEIYIVQRIHFKYITIKDDKKLIRIPIRTYISGNIEFPLHRYDDFNEEKYHAGPWRGEERRKRDILNEDSD